MSRLIAASAAALLAFAGVLVAAPAHAEPITGPTVPIPLSGGRVGDWISLQVRQEWFTPSSGSTVSVMFYGNPGNQFLVGGGEEALDYYTFTYPVQQFWIGLEVHAVVTIKNGTDTLVVNSTTIGPILGSALPGSGTTPDLNGTFLVGDTITSTFNAAPILALPAGVVSYQWWDATANAPIGGETGASFTPGPAHVGVAPYVVISASATFYEAETFQSTIPGVVHYPSWAEGDPPPGIAGSFYVGDPLTVDFDEQEVLDLGGTVGYQWWDAATNTPIAGETGPTFTPNSAQAGVTPYVLITVTAPEYADTTIQSTIPGTVALRPWTQVSAPIVPSTVIVGDTLVAQPGTYSPTPTSYSYQWHRADGSAIDGAVSSSILIDSSLRGEQVYVAETPVRDGYGASLWSSNLTDAVRFPFYPTAGGNPPLSGTFYPDRPIAVQFDVAAIEALGGTVDFQWWDSIANAPLAGETGPTFTPTAAHIGIAPYALVTVNAPGFETTVIQSTIPRVVEEGEFEVVSAPAIDGEAVVGQRLTAASAALIPAATESEFQWFADGAAIDGATDASLEVSPALLGQRLTVVESVSRDGYADAAVESALTAAVRAAPTGLASTGSGIPTPWIALALLATGALLLTRRAALRR